MLHFPGNEQTLQDAAEFDLHCVFLYNKSSMKTPNKITAYVLFNFSFLLLLFLALRAYLFLSGNVGRNFPFSEITAGFFEDILLASALGFLTFLALSLSKILFFIVVFPLEMFIVITSYSNLQYVNFFRENIRLFDLEYLRNIGDLWKSTATDMRFRPGEFLFILIPLLLFLLYCFSIMKYLRKKKTSLLITLMLISVFLAVGVAAFFTSDLLKDKTKPRAFHQNNYFVWMIKDIPRIKALIQNTHAMRKAKISIRREESGLDSFDLMSRSLEKPSEDKLAIEKRPFPLPEGYVWFDDEYPLIKIPERDAVLMHLSPGQDKSDEEDGKSPEPFRPRNVVFLMLESFRCKEIDLFGGEYSITPNFNELASKGILFKNFYGHSDMTGRALLNSLGSLYDTFKGLSVTREYARISLFTLPEILSLFGYRNYYVNSWSADFDNLRIFFKFHGDFGIVDREFFPPDGEKAGWAPSDEEVMRMAVRTLDRARKPFFAIILTSTNHVPYELPNAKFNLGLESGMYGKYLNTFSYTDYALGFFFKLLSTRKYFKDTLFFIFADTGNIRQKRVEEFEPPDRFDSIHHIPLLIYDPSHEEGRVVEEIAGQVDLPPTVLDMLGINIANHFVGQSLVSQRQPTYYLAYHGRDFPHSYYLDDSLFCTVNTDRGYVRAFRRKDSRSVDLSEEQRRKVISSIQDMFQLADWAIFNDHIWDQRLDKFYKKLYRKGGQ